MKSLTKKSKITLVSVCAVLLSAIMVLSGVGIYLKATHKEKTPIVEVNPLDFSIDKWDGTVSAVDYHENYANRGLRTKTINSAASFVHFINEVNSGYTYENYTIYLNSSIDLQGKTINSIGTEEHPFKGTFDGGFYTLYNANINGNGLFEYTNGATIKNIGLYKCNTNLINHAINTNIENSFVRFGNGVLANEYISNQGTHYIKNSFVDSGAEGLISYLDTNLSSANQVTISNSYYTMGDNAVVQTANESFVVADKVLKPVGKSNFSTWDYSEDYDATKTWCDYDYLANSQKLDFNYPLQSGFVKTYLTGSCYESIVNVGGEMINMTNFQEAFNKADTKGDAEINLIVEKVFMEAQATLESANVKINPVVDTEIVRGYNNEGSLFVSAGSAKLELGTEQERAVRTSSSTLVLDGNREHFEQNNLESSALIVAFSDVEVHENVVIKNNTNNAVEHGGAVLAYNSSKINIKGKIENCYAENGGAVAFVSTAEESEIQSLGTIENCSAKLGGGLYITNELPQDAVQAMTRLYGQNVNVRPMTEYDNNHQAEVTTISGADVYKNCTAEKGGAIYNASTATLTVTGNAQFLNNKATGGYGGALYTMFLVLAADILFEGNSVDAYYDSNLGYSNAYGGAVYIAVGGLSIGRSMGSGIYQGGHVQFINNRLTAAKNVGDCYTNYYGAAICINHLVSSFTAYSSEDIGLTFKNNGGDFNYDGSMHGTAIYSKTDIDLGCTAVFDNNRSSSSYSTAYTDYCVYTDAGISLYAGTKFSNNGYCFNKDPLLSGTDGSKYEFVNNESVSENGLKSEDLCYYDFDITFINNGGTCFNITGEEDYIGGDNSLTFIGNTGTCLNLGAGASLDGFFVTFINNSGTCILFNGSMTLDASALPSFEGNTGFAIAIANGTLTIDSPTTFESLGIKLGSGGHLQVNADVEFSNCNYGIYGSSGTSVTVGNGYTLTFNKCSYGISNVGTMSGAIEFYNCEYSIHQNSISTMNVNGNIKIRGGTYGIYDRYGTYSTINLAGNIDIKDCSSYGVHLFWYKTANITGKLIVDGCSYGIYTYGYLQSITIAETASVTLKNNRDRAMYIEDGNLYIYGNLVLENNSSSGGYEIEIENDSSKSNVIYLYNDIDVRSTNGATTFYLGCYSSGSTYGTYIYVTTQLQNVYSVYKENIQTSTSSALIHRLIFQTFGVTLDSPSNLKPFYVTNLPSGATIGYEPTSGYGVVMSGTPSAGVIYNFEEGDFRTVAVGEIVSYPVIVSHSATVNVSVGGPAFEYIGSTTLNAGFNYLQFKAVQEGLNTADITITCNGETYTLPYVAIEVISASTDPEDPEEPEDPAIPEEDVYPADELWLSTQMVDVYKTAPVMMPVLVHIPDNYSANSKAAIRILTSDNTVVNTTTSSDLYVTDLPNLFDLTKYLEIRAVGYSIITVELYNPDKGRLYDIKKVYINVDDAPSFLEQTYFEIAIGEKVDCYVTISSYDSYATITSSDPSVISSYIPDSPPYGSFNLKNYTTAGLKEGYALITVSWTSYEYDSDSGYSNYVNNEGRIVVKVYDPAKRMRVSATNQELLIGEETNITVALPDIYKTGYVKFSTSDSSVISVGEGTNPGKNFNLSNYTTINALGSADITIELYSDSSCATLVDTQIVQIKVSSMKISATEYYLQDGQEAHIIVQVAEIYNTSMAYISCNSATESVADLGTTFDLADDPFNIASPGQYTIGLIDFISNKTYTESFTVISAGNYLSLDQTYFEVIKDLPIDISVIPNDVVYVTLSSSNENVIKVGPKNYSYTDYNDYMQKYCHFYTSTAPSWSLSSYLTAVDIGYTTITMYPVNSGYETLTPISFTVRVVEGFVETDLPKSFTVDEDYLGSITSLEDDLKIKFYSDGSSINVSDPDPNVDGGSSHCIVNIGETIYLKDYLSIMQSGTSNITITFYRDNGETVTTTYTVSVATPYYTITPSTKVTVQLGEPVDIGILTNGYPSMYFRIESSDENVVRVTKPTQTAYNGEKYHFYQDYWYAPGFAYESPTNISQYCFAENIGTAVLTIKTFVSEDFATSSYNLPDRKIYITVTGSYAIIEDVSEYIFSGDEMSGKITAKEDGIYVKFGADAIGATPETPTISGPDNNTYHVRLDEGDVIYLKDYITIYGSPDFRYGWDLVIPVSIYRTSTGEVETQSITTTAYNPWFSVSSNNITVTEGGSLDAKIICTSGYYIYGNIELLSGDGVVSITNSSFALYGDERNLSDYVSIIGKGTATIKITGTDGDPYPTPPNWTETITINVMEKFFDLQFVTDLFENTSIMYDGYIPAIYSNYYGYIKSQSPNDTLYLTISCSDYNGCSYQLENAEIEMPNGEMAHARLNNGEIAYIHDYITIPRAYGEELTISVYSEKLDIAYYVVKTIHKYTSSRFSSDVVTVSPGGIPYITANYGYQGDMPTYARIYSSNYDVVDVTDPTDTTSDNLNGEFEYHFKTNGSGGEIIDLSQYLIVNDVEGEAYITVLEYSRDAMGLEYYTFLLKVCEAPLIELEDTSVVTQVGGEIGLDVKAIYGDNTHITLTSKNNNVVRVVDATGTEVNGKKSHFTINKNASKSVNDYLKVVGVGSATITVSAYYPAEGLSYELVLVVVATPGKLATPEISPIFSGDSNGSRAVFSWAMPTETNLVSITYDISVMKDGEFIYSLTTTQTSVNLAAGLQSYGAGAYSISVKAISSDTSKFANSEICEESPVAYARMVNIQYADGISGVQHDNRPISSKLFIQGEKIRITAQLLDSYEFVSWTSNDPALLINSPSDSTTDITLSTTSTSASEITINATAKYVGITVSFGVNYEGYGIVSEESIRVTSGTSISVDGNQITIGGKTVTATSTARTPEYTYSFVDWSGLGGATTITRNMMIVANFSRQVNSYNIKFTVHSDSIGYGEMSVPMIVAPYGSRVTFVDNKVQIGNNEVVAIPTTASSQYVYKFAGWDGKIEVVGETTEIFAHFVREINNCTVTFIVNNANYGSVESVTTITAQYNSHIIVSGANITINGTTVTATPALDSPRYDYEFVEWRGATSTLTGDMIITAVFSRTERSYTITIVSNNTEFGDVSIKTLTLLYGASIVATDNILMIGNYYVTALTTEDTPRYDYSFTGWSIASGVVDSHKTITANFTRTEKVYTVTIRVENQIGGTVTETSIQARYGAKVVITDNVITIDEVEIIATANEGYKFARWIGAVGLIEGAITIRAQFDAV